MSASTSVFYLFVQWICSFDCRVLIPTKLLAIHSMACTSTIQKTKLLILSLPSCHGFMLAFYHWFILTFFIILCFLDLHQKSPAPPVILRPCESCFFFVVKIPAFFSISTSPDLKPKTTKNVKQNHQWTCWGFSIDTGLGWQGKLEDDCENGDSCLFFLRNLCIWDGLFHGSI